nr:phosphopantetheine-binding protein [uncultured Acetatifactor sp.]
MEELMEILSNLHPDVEFETEERLVDDKILDSFDIVSLIAEINETFDIAITAKDILPENFNSAKALYALIQKLEEEA